MPSFQGPYPSYKQTASQREAHLLARAATRHTRRFRKHLSIHSQMCLTDSTHSSQLKLVRLAMQIELVDRVSLSLLDLLCTQILLSQQVKLVKQEIAPQSNVQQFVRNTQLSRNECKVSCFNTFFSLCSLLFVIVCSFTANPPTCLLDSVSVLPSPRPKIYLDFGILLHRCVVFLGFQS